MQRRSKVSLPRQPINIVIFNNASSSLCPLGSCDHHKCSHSHTPLFLALSLHHCVSPSPPGSDSFLSPSQIVFCISKWQWQRLKLNSAQNISDRGERNIFILLDIPQVIHQKVHFSLKYFPYLKSTDMSIYHEVKKIELHFVS